MPVLHLKLIRDLRRLWAQGLAIALVMAAGVATLLLGVGAYTSLAGTRAAYYDANRFADVFADLTRAPDALVGDIAAIPGVLQAEARITKLGLLDMPTMDDPGAAFLVSLPPTGPAALNRLHLRSGRLPDDQAPGEAAVSEGFARAHGLQPGSRIDVLMNGHKRTVTVTGTAISPEFIYAIGPGDLMPDERRFGIIWMPRSTLAAAWDLDGAFSNVILKTAPGADVRRIIANLDRLLDPYGGAGAIQRKDQISHAFLDAELKQLRGMSIVLPPIFLIVAAFLVNMTLSRLVMLEREQIGLLKAVGYSNRTVALHYVEFAALIAVIGIVIGWGVGTWLGQQMAQLYARFFNFPFLVFTRDPALYALAALVTLSAAVLGAAGAARRVAILPPAVAMAPPAPPRYRRFMSTAARRLTFVRQTTVMVLRHLWHSPGRTAASVLGVAFAVAVLVGSLWSRGSIEEMVSITFFQADRQDATISFSSAQPLSAVFALRGLPGILAAEPFRMVPVNIAHDSASRDLALTGKPALGELSRVLDTRVRPMRLPDHGVVLSEALAAILRVTTGETVTITLKSGDRRSLAVPVSGISLGYLGLGAYMDIDSMGRLLGEDSMVSGANVAIDPTKLPALNAALKKTPVAGFIVQLDRTLQRFRDTLAENITILITIYTTFASVIAVGVVYNFARISLSEQGRELASLRVLGFTNAEVAGVLFGEIAIIVLLAQPFGWAMGYGLAVAMTAAFSSELYRVPLVVTPSTYATASLAVLAAAIGSAVMVRRRITRLDMIEVLKTRE